MNRRAFLAGLATTTAIVATGVVPEAPAAAVRFGAGYPRIRSWSEFAGLEPWGQSVPQRYAAMQLDISAGWRRVLDEIAVADPLGRPRAVYIETDDEIIYRDDEVSLRQLKRPIRLDAAAIAELTRA